MPNWVWWALGIGCVAVLTFVGYACLIVASRADDDRERRTRQRLYGANGLRPVTRRRLQIERGTLRPTTGFRAWLYEHAWMERPERAAGHTSRGGEISQVLAHFEPWFTGLQRARAALVEMYVKLEPLFAQMDECKGPGDDEPEAEDWSEEDGPGESLADLERLRADAALGALVRRMPVGMRLEHSLSPLYPWEVWEGSVGRWELSPEAALRDALLAYRPCVCGL